MRLIFITPGTGNYYCGVCMRDNALVQALRQQGHDAVMLPMYLPLMTDEPSVAEDMPIFFGGVNVYLQHHFSLFRHTPQWVDRLFDSKFVLRFAASRSGMTQSAGLGHLTVSMLLGESGNQAKEVEKLVHWLEERPPPDVVYLSTALQVGLVRRMRKRIKTSVCCFLQGEDAFLDELPEPFHEEAWATLSERARDIDEFIAPSEYFAGLMTTRLNLNPQKVRVIANGISLRNFGDYSKARSVAQPIIGYLARMIPGKGLGTLVDAFIILMQTSSHPDCQLKIAGAAIPMDEPFLEEQKRKLETAGLARSVEFLPNISRADKLAFLHGLTLFSVPATYGEAFGLYVLEAMAAGIPVIQPDHGAFPEILRDTGGGRLCRPDDPEDLAATLKDLLDDPEKAEELGHQGQRAMTERYSIQVMARTVANAAETVVRAVS